MSTELPPTVRTTRPSTKPDAYLARMSRQTGRPWRAVVVEQDLDISGRSFARAGIQKLRS